MLTTIAGCSVVAAFHPQSRFVYIWLHAIAAARLARNNDTYAANGNSHSDRNV